MSYMKNGWIGIIGVLVLGFLLIISIPSSAEKKVTIAVGVDALTLMPNEKADSVTNHVVEHIFDTLIWRDNQLEMEPALATNWEPIDDLTWEFELREGVKWHDGEEFTAEDVKFTLDWILDPDNDSDKQSYHVLVDSVEIVDDYTVRIHTKEPHPMLLTRLTMTQIKPKHYYEGRAYDEVMNKPIGTGPFKFIEWVRDERVVMEAYSDHWRGEPEIQNLEFRVIPESSTRVAELMVGNVDIIVNVPPHQIPAVEGSENARIIDILGGRTIFMGINSLKEGPLQDERVRKALNYAVDVDAIVNHILDGHGKPIGPGGLSTYHFGYDPNIEPYGYDPEKAKELLAEAGYPDGFPINVAIPDGRYLMDRAVGEAVAGMLDEIGLDVSHEVLEWGTHIGRITSRDVDLYLLGWGAITVDADGTLDPQYMSGNPYSFTDDEKVDELIYAGRTTVDFDEREEIYKELLSYLEQKAYRLYLYQQGDIYGVSERLEWTPRPDERPWVYHGKIVE